MPVIAIQLWSSFSNLFALLCDLCGEKKTSSDANGCGLKIFSAASMDTSVEILAAILRRVVPGAGLFLCAGGDDDLSC
jgi:hypothetical protein